MVPFLPATELGELLCFVSVAQMPMAIINRITPTKPSRLLTVSPFARQKKSALSMTFRLRAWVKVHGLDYAPGKRIHILSSSPDDKLDIRSQHFPYLRNERLPAVFFLFGQRRHELHNMADHRGCFGRGLLAQLGIGSAQN